MSKKIVRFLSGYKGKKLLAVFPHADDASFVAGGLFQLLKKMHINTKLICVTKPKNKKQLDHSSKVLGIDDIKTFDYDAGKLAIQKDWLNLIKKEIDKTKPFAVLTFDPHGITGNTDHVETSVGLFSMLREMKNNKPVLLWRVSDSQEKAYFDKKKEVKVDIEPTFYHFLRLTESLKKMKAIFMYKGKFKSFLYRLMILEWYLFDHKELYYLVDFDNNKYQIIVN